jgi:hypothetical protein
MHRGGAHVDGYGRTRSASVTELPDGRLVRVAQQRGSEQESTCGWAVVSVKPARSPGQLAAAPHRCSGWLFHVERTGLEWRRRRSSRGKRRHIADARELTSRYPEPSTVVAQRVEGPTPDLDVSWAGGVLPRGRRLAIREEWRSLVVGMMEPPAADVGLALKDFVPVQGARRSLRGSLCRRRSRSFAVDRSATSAGLLAPAFRGRSKAFPIQCQTTCQVAHRGGRDPRCLRLTCNPSGTRDGDARSTWNMRSSSCTWWAPVDQATR